ncbi:hypothetical protein WMY93_029707 [Mugilogobius chulae]|uniref:F5/8 type C domain-containing protein n=1 Tax=Mugilogobius chulae TaxID=88201 RepID=A0AAW0MKL4_9GOBI
MQVKTLQTEEEVGWSKEQRQDQRKRRRGKEVQNVVLTVTSGPERCPLYRQVQSAVLTVSSGAERCPHCIVRCRPSSSLYCQVQRVLLIVMVTTWRSRGALSVCKQQGISQEWKDCEISTRDSAAEQSAGGTQQWMDSFEVLERQSSSTRSLHHLPIGGSEQRQSEGERQRARAAEFLSAVLFCEATLTDDCCLRRYAVYLTDSPTASCAFKMHRHHPARGLPSFLPVAFWIFSGVRGILQTTHKCDEPLASSLSHTAFTSSSVFSNGYAPGYAKLNRRGGAGGWSPLDSDHYQWLQVTWVRGSR